MKRAPIVAVSTVAGIAGVLLLNPSGSGASLAMKTTAADTGTSSSGAGATTTTKPTGSSTSTGGTTSTTSSKAQPSGTATGDAIDAQYGMVQVKVTAKNGKIVDVTAVQLPNGDGRSQYISQQVEPMLKQQALSAQSANIQGVSGASFTSNGYAQSLQSALSKLGM